MIQYKDYDKNFNLNGRNAVVTGGANGIGRAIAELFAEKGANICIFDLSDSGAEVAEEFEKKYNIRCFFIKTDITGSENIQRSADFAEEKLGSVDILVNCAGVVFLDAAESLSEKDWDTTIAVNQKSIFLVSQIIGRKMIKQGYGKIINMASQAGVIALDKHLAYCASKGAVISMTKVLAYEWAQYGINVNAISPTVVLTELGKKAWAGEVGEAMKKLIPNGRFAYPNEIAAVALFLASDASAMINGENILIDGGYTIK